MTVRTRINWRAILGYSLSDYIITLKAKGLNKQEVFYRISDDPNLQEYWRKHPSIRQYMRLRLSTSIDARFSENNNAVRRYLNARE